MTHNNPDTAIQSEVNRAEPLSATARKTLLVLKERLGNSASEQRSATASRRLRITLPVKEIDLLAWLHSRVGSNKFYWRNRENDMEVAAVGAAEQLSLESRERLTQVLNEIRRCKADSQEDLLPNSYLISPFDIDLANDDSNRQPFQGYRAKLVTPAVMLARSRSSYYLIVNIDRREILEQDRELTKISELLTFPVKPIPKLGRAVILNRSDSPTRERWSNNVDSALEAIKSGSAGKVVLARKTDLRLSGTVDPFALLSTLRESNNSAYAFLIQIDSEQSFVGISPERLFKITGDQLVTEAIAGTAPRGRTDDSDKVLAEELLHSQKNLSEQKFVIDAVRGAVEDFCVGESNSPVSPDLLRLSRVQHLITRFSGTLKDSARLGDLFSYLFPTPAVCGSPRDKAMNLIRELDGFDRETYAGSIGVIGPQSSDFAVAIRSLFVRRDQVSLYAGAGIVPGSDASLEWEELNHKLATILAVLDGTN